VLAAIARGEGSGPGLMLQSHTSDPRYPITDGKLIGVLKGLGSAGFIEGAPTGKPGPETLAAIKPSITALGRQALAGAIDRVHEVGIDEWRCGVHLSGKGPVWRWDSRERKLIER
jgi:hypothetical protein